MKDAGQRIVYLLNPHVGHLGIFVSAKVARFEHRAMLENMDELEQLGPGLYEMKIDNPSGDPDCSKSQYRISFEERQVEDIDYESNPQAFEKVDKISQFNTSLYETFVGPWVRSMVSPWSAEFLKSTHPMRINSYLYSEQFNPLMGVVPEMAARVREDRKPINRENPYIGMEQEISHNISESLDVYRKFRDAAYQQIFNGIYGK